MYRQKKWHEGKKISVESKTLNYPESMRLSYLLMQYAGKYQTDTSQKAYIIYALSQFTVEEIGWVRSILSPNSIYPMVQLEEIYNGICDNELVELCSVKEEKC